MTNVVRKFALTFDQKVMAVLTSMIVVAAATQAYVSIRQTVLLEAAYDREIVRDNALVKITFNASSGREGFSCVNVGYRDVVISHAYLELDPPPGTYESRLLIDLGDPAVSLPKRLQPGESVTFLEEERRLVQATKDERLRPVCLDTFGNKHRFGGWVVWEEGAFSNYAEPGPGWGEIDR